MKQQSDAVTHPKLGLLCRGEGQNRNCPQYSLELSGHRARKQKTPPLVGNKAKLDSINNKESWKCVMLVRNFSFDMSSSHKQTHTCGQDKQSSLFGFRKGKRKICHSVCYVQQYCTVHFINKMLSAIVQHYLNKIPLGHKEQQLSISVGRRAETPCCI